MKRILCVLSLIILLAISSACSKPDDIIPEGYVGVNAEILEVNDFVKGFTVKSLDANSILGEKFYVNCEGPDIYFIYVNNETGEVSDITYSDFLVGDEISIDFKSMENKYTLAKRVQLETQRR